MFTNELVGIGLAGECQDTHFEVLFQEEGDGALSGGLAGGVRVVVHDDSAGESAQQLDLRLGETGAAASHHVANPSAGDGDGVHVAFDQHREIGSPQRFFGAVQVIQQVAF